uniref:DUF1618 domain-containing protein n=1 Tax=Aegilops tauschii TaxID=37682 RepID=R7VZB8_AEGTA
MAAPPSWPLLNDSAGYYERADYGCGPLGERVVDGLALLARRDGGDGDQTELCLRAADDVLRLFCEMVPGEVARICGHREIADEQTEIIGTHVRFYARVDAVDGERGLVVFSRHFLADEYVGNLRSYYLVHDSAAASLSLLPQLPRQCPAVYDKRPLLVCHRDDGSYSLVLMAISSEQWTDDLLVRPVICQWSPPTPQSLSGDSRDKGDGICLWRTRQVRQLCAVPIWFEISAQVFTCKGKAFWADLKQCLLYCDCADLLNDGDDDIEFTYVALPKEYRVDRWRS